MAIDNQQVIVEVVADASKAVQGLNEVFETARRHSKDGSGLENIQADIKKLQSQSIETSKAVEVMRTALKGIGNSEDINTLNTQMADMEKNISAVSKALENMNNVSSIEAVNKAMDKVDTKMKGLDTTLSSVKLMVKGVFTPMEEQTKEVSAEVEALTKRIEELKKAKNTIKNSSKEISTVKVDNDTIKKAYTNLGKCISKANELKESLSSATDSLQKKDLSKQLNVALNKEKDTALKIIQMENAVNEGTNPLANKKNIIEENLARFKEAHTVINNITKNIDNNIANTEAKIKEATGEIKAQVSSFDVKEGKISVPVEMTESSALVTELNATLSNLQEIAAKKPIKILVKAVSSLKQKAVDAISETPEIKNIQEQIDLQSDPSVKKKAQSLLNSLKDQMESAVTVEVKLNTKKATEATKEAIAGIQSQLKTVGKDITLVPTLKLDPTEVETVKKELNDLLSLDKMGDFNTITTDFTNSFKKLTKTKWFDDWEKSFSIAVNEVTANLNDAFVKSKQALLDYYSTADSEIKANAKDDVGNTKTSSDESNVEKLDAIAEELGIITEDSTKLQGIVGNIVPNVTTLVNQIHTLREDIENIKNNSDIISNIKAIGIENINAKSKDISDNKINKKSNNGLNNVNALTNDAELQKALLNITAVTTAARPTDELGKNTLDKNGIEDTKEKIELSKQFGEAIANHYSKLTDREYKPTVLSATTFTDEDGINRIQKAVIKLEDAWGDTVTRVYQYDKILKEIRKSGKSDTVLQEQVSGYKQVSETLTEKGQENIQKFKSKRQSIGNSSKNTLDTVWSNISDTNTSNAITDEQQQQSLLSSKKEVISAIRKIQHASDEEALTNARDLYEYSLNQLKIKEKQYRNDVKNNTIIASQQQQFEKNKSNIISSSKNIFDTKWNQVTDKNATNAITGEEHLEELENRRASITESINRMKKASSQEELNDAKKLFDLSVNQLDIQTRLFKNAEQLNNKQQKQSAQFISKKQLSSSSDLNGLNEQWSKAIDPNSSNAVKEQNHINELIKIRQEILKNIYKEQQASDEQELNTAQIRIKNSMSELNIKKSEFKNAEKTAEAFRSKDVSSRIPIQGQKIESFVANVKSNTSNVPYELMQSDVSSLNNMLSKVTDSKSMTAFLEKFDSVKERYKTLNKSLADISKIKLDGKTMGINTLLDYLQNSSETSDETKQHIIDLRTELSKVGTSDEGIVKASELITSFTTEISNATEKEKELQKVNEQISGLRQRLSNDVSIADNGSNLGQGQTEAYRETVEKLNQTLTEYEEILIKSKVIGEQAWIDSGKSAEQYETEMKQMFKTLENGSLLQNQIGKNGSRSIAIESLSSPLTQNAEQTRDMIQQYVSGIEGANVATLKTVGNTNKWSVEVHNLGEQAKILELSYNGVWTSTEKAIKANLNPLEKLNGLIKKSADYFASYFSGYMVAQQIISTIREAFSTVKDLDTAMVEVRKVSDETEASYANFSKTISQTAKEVAGTNKDLLTSSADWMRLGYSINDAAELAKDAQVFVNVGDGVDMQAATSDMITAMKAYNIEAKDAMSTIIDAYNIIGEQKLPNTQKCA